MSSPSPRGSPCFGVIERATGRRFLAQRKPMDEDLERDIQMHNVLRASPDLAQLRQVVLEENGDAVLVYENADRSFLDSLLPPPSARRSLSRSPSSCAGGESPKPVSREEQVQVFVKQLLTALQYMHRRGIAHLDLRPEVILLQDDHLRLADFGQSRRLLNGKVVGGTIKSNPEFVSPEVVAGGTVTLAADMWSVGALTYVLLTGQSPFLGDNDEETLQNVLKGQFKTEGSTIDQLSAQSKDFVQRLLSSDPLYANLPNKINQNSSVRLNVEQALAHDWLSDPTLGDAKLSTDCLREFKYQHKWLERRVFVQQTPSDQLTQLVEAPRASLCMASSEETPKKAGAQPVRAEPFAVYDYLRIKEESRPEGARRDIPMQMRDAVGRNLPASQGRPGQRQSPGPYHSPSPHRQSPHGGCGTGSPQQQGPPRYPTEAPPVPDWIIAQLPPGVKAEHLCWDPYGGGFYLPPQYQPGGGQQPHGGQTPPPLPPRSRSSSERHQSPGGPPTGGPPAAPQLAPLPAGIAKKIEAMTAAAAQKEQQPIATAKPSEFEALEELARQLGVTDLKLEDLKNPQSSLMKLIRGERRQIQDELANRVLSDISEESSIIDSTTQNSDRSTARQQVPKLPVDEDASTTTTAEHEGPSSSTATPLASPAFTGEDPHFFADQVASPPEVLDEREQHFTSQQLPLNVTGYLGDAPFPNGKALESAEAQLAARGVKSPVQLVPREEHEMSVQIGIGKREKEEAGKKEEAEKQQNGDLPDKAAQAVTETGGSQFRPPADTEFDLLMDAVERVKQDQTQRINGQKQRPQIPVPPPEDDLERYRPYSIYKEYELDVKRQKQQPLDDFAWESQYQIGPETLLVPTMGARFNARVRDYRRGIWGDSAAYVISGELGERNADVTVRERRRYTDLIREDPLVAKSVDTVLEGLLQSHEGALRRVEGVQQNGQQKINGEKSPPTEANGKNGEKRFPPIFRSRLRDGFFCDGAPNVVFECQAVGNPATECTFFHHESAICEDGRHQITRHGNTWKLTILKPLAGVDTGEYSCVAENELGRDKCVCKCASGEPPYRPSRPDVELSADTEVYLSWEPPERLPVTLEGVHYRLECRPAGEKDAFAAWTVVSNCVEDEAAVVKHLMPMGIYQFRVTAGNEFGWGEPSIHSRIIRTHPRGIPKLNLDLLRREGRRFAVVTMPQKSGRKGAGLTEIQEDLAELEDVEEDEADAERVSEQGGDKFEESNGNGTKRVPLNTTEDPLKRFQLESELFRGQFSVIRYAIDSKSGAHCTVKIRAAPSHGSLMFATPAERMKAALVEYETLADCQHENVVQLIAAYCSDNAFQLLFTERLYENLFQRFIRMDSYTEEQITFVIRQIASAIRWIHFNGVVHGDLEPTNVMFTTKRSWWVKLVDFGRARQIGSREGLAGDGQLLAEWTAPETLVARMGRNGNGNGQVSPNGQRQGEQLANPQTDMWGLGLIAFCLLAGFHPFADDDDSEQEVRQHVLEQRCDPNLIPVQASEEALRFAVWALKKDPSRRMRPEEALAHRWLATDGAMVRRRENIRYGSHRLVRTAERRLRHQCQFARNGNGGGGGSNGNGTHTGGPPGSPRNTQNGQSNGFGGKNGGNGFGSRLAPPGQGQMPRGPPQAPMGGMNGQNGGQRAQPQQRRKVVSAEC